MRRKSITLLTLLASVYSQAQIHCNDSLLTEDTYLEEIVVTGFTGKQKQADAVHPFTIVSPQKIEHSVAMNLMDLVAREPGLAQISTGNSISKPVIRGLGYNRVVLIADGVRQEGQQWGEEHGVEVGSSSVGSVEVLKGPASLIYGSDAMAGVMILHPKKVLPQGEMKGYAETEYQSNNGLIGVSAGHAGNKNRFCWDWNLSERIARAYKNKHDGRVNGSQFQQFDVNGLLGWNRDWGHSHLRMGYFHLMPSIASDEATGNSYRRSLPFQQVGHAKLVSENKIYMPTGSLDVIVGYQNNDRQEYEESRDESELAMNLNTVTYDIRYHLEDWHEWTFATGIGGMYQHSQNRAEEQLIPNYGLFDAGLYGTMSRRTGKWNFTGGLRGDIRHLTLKRNFSGMTGSAGAVWNVIKDFNIRANVSRGYRAPNVSELSADGVHEGSYRYEKGNLNLRPEFSWQGDIGMDYVRKHWGINLSVFSNRIENYIYSRKLYGVQTDGYQTYQYQQGDATLYGGEVAIDVHPIKDLHIENTFSYVRGIQHHVSAEEKDLPLIPAPRWNGEVRYEFSPDTYLAANFEWNLKQDHYYRLDNTETATPGYTLVGLAGCTHIHWKKRLLAHLMLSVNNLFDVSYQNHLSRLKYAETEDGKGFYGMGRNVCVKLTFPLN